MPRVRRLRRIPQLIDFERGRIIGLHEAGFSVREISTNRSLRTILRWYQAWTEKGQEHRARDPGRRRGKTEREDRRLRISGLKNTEGLLECIQYIGE